jgi:hypothetical protein
MRRLHCALALLLIPFALPSCKGGNGSGGGSGPGCATCGPYGDVLGALCDIIDRCPSATAAYPIAYRSHSECVQELAFLSTCRIKDTHIDNKLDFTLQQEIPKVDQQHADACVTWLKGLSCDAIGNTSLLGRKTTPCDNVIVSNDNSSSSGPAAGDPCPNNNCAHGLYCSTPVLIQSSLELTCAVCKELPVSGQDCRISSSRCADGFYCQSIAMTSSAACAPVKAPGAACEGNDQCASMFCNQGPKTCDSGGDVGDPCMVPTDCRYQLFCDTAAGHCAKVADYGQPCTTNMGCLNGNCDTNAGVCGNANGSPCSTGGAGGADPSCASGYCDATSRMCSAAKANGSACMNASECMSRYCDFSFHTCIAHCYNDSDCPMGQHCPYNFNNQVCQPLGADGAGCEKPSDCVSNWCLSSQKCGKKPAIGDACASSPDCYPLGYCTGGKCAKRNSPGSSCDAIDSCEDPFLCLNKTCTPMYLECKGAPVGSLCTFLHVCDPDAYCEIPSFVCKQAAHLGEKCGAIPCGKDLFCDPAMTTCASKHAAGGACQSGDQCQDGLYCVPGASGMTCSMGPEGRPCDSGRSPCPQGLFCKNNTCHAPGMDGADCNSSSECIAADYCSIGGGPGHGCQPRPMLGGACWSDIPCATGFWCDDNSRSCKADATAGQMCESSPGPFGIECAPGNYCTYDPNMRMNLCIAQKATGQVCEQAQECMSGACQYNQKTMMQECLASSQCVMP